nr:MAG TPA: hypothetical protein [Caudoviricetes sp.]
MNLFSKLQSGDFFSCHFSFQIRKHLSSSFLDFS